MRTALLRTEGTPHHVSLAYDAWAPIGAGGEVPEEGRSDWLAVVAGVSISPDYGRFFTRWKSSFGPQDMLAVLTLNSRLLVGQGNSSATDVGITVHHTWGVPIIPGSALKGLLAHYIDAVYGPDDSSTAPWEQAEAKRARFQGITWRGTRVARGPGEIYRGLFGAPESEEDPEARRAGHAAGPTAGLVTFHDALYVPGSTPEDRPFAADVLTVHQKSYYDAHQGTPGRGIAWPNDHDRPNPVVFLTVRPRAQLLLALTGPAEWIQLAGRLLGDALYEWGVGSKTSAGYGVGKVGQWDTPTAPPSSSLQRFLGWLKDPPPEADGSRLTWRQFVDKIEADWTDLLAQLDEAERNRAADAIREKIRSPKLVARREAILERILATRE